MFFEDGVAYVYLLQDGKAVRSDVTIGLYTADEIAVTGGLTPGDQVITTWSASLRDGADVRLAGAETDAPADSSAPADSPAASSQSSSAASGETAGGEAEG